MNYRFDFTTHFVRFFFVGLVVLFVALLLFGLKELAIPFSIAFLLSIFLSPAVDFIEGLGINRIISVVIVLTLLSAGIYVVLALLIPQLSVEMQRLTGELSKLTDLLPGLIQSVREKLDFILPDTYRDIKIDVPWLVDLILGPIKNSNILGSLPSILTYSIITPIVLFIFLLQGDDIFRGVMGLVPNRFFEMTLLIIHQIRAGIISYLKGLSIQFVILSCIFVPGLYFVDIPYGPVLGLFAAFVNVIPYIGPALGAGPIIVVALISGNGVLASALIVLAIGHIIDNVFTQPVILARSVDVHPIVAVLAVITFQNWFGLAGMVIALPLAGIMVMTIQTMYRSLKSFGII
ncbi:MAG: AI-2E family transporter [Leptonema sp. (in: Bacteria)]|nr:AI-2E family transporter [Leptonema sp. (in: bacteria)]